MDMVVEAVFEDINLKHQMVQDVERGAASTVFASNTSSCPSTRSPRRRRIRAGGGAALLQPGGQDAAGRGSFPTRVPAPRRWPASLRPGQGKTPSW